jgi:hypothetical protein
MSACIWLPLPGWRYQTPLLAHNQLLDLYCPDMCKHSRLPAHNPVKMEPVREEESGRLDEGNDAPLPVRKSSIKSPPFTASRRTNTRGELPSLKYKNIDDPVNPVLLRRAQSPPRPTLPRRQRVRTWQATAKERNPLASSLTGS